MLKRKKMIMKCFVCNAVQKPIETKNGFDHYEPRCTECGGMIMPEKVDA